MSVRKQWMQRRNIHQNRAFEAHLYTSPSLPLAVMKFPSELNETALALPFIFRSATHIFDFVSTTITYPSFPIKAIRLPSGEVVNFSSDFSLRP